MQRGSSLVDTSRYDSLDRCRHRGSNHWLERGEERCLSLTNLGQRTCQSQLCTDRREIILNTFQLGRRGFKERRSSIHGYQGVYASFISARINM